MGFRFNKRVKIAKGVTLNFGKKGMSTSFKIGNTTINSRGRVTTSIPGTGISYSTNLNKKDIRPKQKQTFTQKMEQSTNKMNETIEKMNEISDKVGNKNNYYLSWVSYVLAWILVPLSLLLMLANTVLGGFFIIIAIIINRVSKKNIKKYKEAVESEKQLA